MEGSFVKLKIAEKEERLKIDREKKNQKPVNGIVQKDGKYYLVRLEMELEKLKSLINEAESDQRLSQITEEASGKIRNAIGKAQLLITKKFKQFEELCRDNIEDNPDKRQNEMETKSSDLQGYWEMMFTQIDDVKALFSHIEKLKANNWRSAEVEQAELSQRNSAAASPTDKGKSSTKSSESTTRVKKTKKNTASDEKVKREARSRLAAIRKQAKLRQQEDPDSFTIQINGCSTDKLDNSALLNNNETLESSENGSLNSSFNADASLNSSLNSSLEVLSDNNSCDIQQSITTALGES